MMRVKDNQGKEEKEILERLWKRKERREEELRDNEKGVKEK